MSKFQVNFKFGFDTSTIYGYVRIISFHFISRIYSIHLVYTATLALNIITGFSYLSK